MYVFTRLMIVDGQTNDHHKAIKKTTKRKKSSRAAANVSLVGESEEWSCGARCCAALEACHQL